VSHKYGILQSSGVSCIFYKEDENGKQSTFNLYVSSDKEMGNKKTLTALIDNEQVGLDNWFGDKNISVEDVIKAFYKWAPDAPVLFQMEAQESLSQCLYSIMKIEE
jgi:hypothetical protein